MIRFIFSFLFFLVSIDCLATQTCNDLLSDITNQQNQQSDTWWSRLYFSYSREIPVYLKPAFRRDVKISNIRHSPNGGFLMRTRLSKSFDSDYEFTFSGIIHKAEKGQVGDIVVLRDFDKGDLVGLFVISKLGFESYAGDLLYDVAWNLTFVGKDLENLLNSENTNISRRAENIYKRIFPSR